MPEKSSYEADFEKYLRHTGADKSYYKSKSFRLQNADNRTEEADKVSSRIAQILSEPSFNFSPSYLIAVHKRLFDGIFKFAGRLRDYDITKNEWVLNGDTVMYGAAFELKTALEYDFMQEKKFRYKNLSMDDEHNELKNRETHIDYAKYAGKVSEETTEKNKFTTEKEAVPAKNTTEKILCAIKENPYITTKELALKFDITEDGVFYHVKKLRLSGRIKRSGGRKKGYWEIVEEK